MTFATQSSPVSICAASTVISPSSKTYKTVFDFRSDQPQTLPLFLEFIHATFKQSQEKSAGSNSEFVVIFMGAAVTLLSTTKSDHAIESKIAAMAKDGIRLELCQLAANAFGVDMNAILPGLLPVANGWMSLIDYQTDGYALVPVY